MKLGFIGSRSVRITVTVGLLAVLAAVIEWQELMRLFGQVSWQLLIPLYALLGSSRIVEAYQLKLAISYFGRGTSLIHAFLANALATFYGFVLPGEALATIPKWLILSKGTGSRSAILNAIVYNRIALLIPPVVIGCIVLTIIDPFETRSMTYLVGASGCAIVIGALLLFRQRTGALFLNAIAYLAGKFPRKIENAVATVIASFARVHALAFRHHLAAYTLSLSVALIRILGFIFAAQIVLIDVPPHILALAYTLIVILGLFPLTIGNIGIREGVLIYVLQMFGISPTQSILLGLVLLGEQIMFAILGGAYQVNLSRRPSLAGRY